MADTPQPQSYEQLDSDMLSSYAAKLGINDFNVGSLVTSFFEVVALMVARSSGDIFQILRDLSVDRATGDALKKLATDNKVTPITAKPATGSVTVTDTSFQKISTKVYAGAAAPNIGSTQIKVSDASLFTPTGAIYIGRGTPNIEGPLSYTSITPSGSFFIINLSVATTKFHNVGETVILAQGGNRSVPVNSVVISPAVGTSTDISFLVTNSAVILDGETTVENVQVTAQIPGAAGNVPRGAIKQFSTPPFTGASVTNPLPFTTGADNETDDQLRVRIKLALASKGLGTASAIKASVIGAKPSDENATVVSDNIVNTSIGAILYIDDGNGYEAKTAGVGLEKIVDSALGGEQFFQLATGGRQAPVAKAFLETTLSAPFDLIGGDTLAVVVGEQTYQHVFDNADFRSPGGATSFEITASINADTLLGFEATTSGGGQFVVIRAKAESNDSLKITTPTTSGRDAAIQMGFPANEVQTLRLYKNKIPLNKDGKTASVFTQSQQLWSATIATGDTLIVGVDSTAEITYTITDADFIATGLYTTVSFTNSLDSWAEVLNAKLTGVTVEVVGQQLKLTSNLGASNRAALVIDTASTLVTKGMFSSTLGLSSEGKASDFTLDRNTAQFELVVPLQAEDELSAGSTETEARIESGVISGGSISFSADAHAWILIDNPGEIIPTGVAGSTLVAVSKPSTNVVRYTSNVSNAFANVLLGDYVIIWSNDFIAANRLEGRVNAVTNTTLDILVTATEWAAVVPVANVIFSEGFVVLRSSLAPQKFRLTAGIKTLDDIANELQAQTLDLIFTVLQDQFLVVRSTEKNTDGSILVVTVDAQGKLLTLPVGTQDNSKDSLIAFYDTSETEGQLPLFIHAGFASGTAANPIDSFISSFISSISLAGRDPNELIGILQPYGSSKDAQPYGEFVQEDSIVGGTTINIENESVLRRLRVVDRYFIANPLDFGSQDTMVTIVDNDANSKSFEVPLYRKALTNTTLASNPSNFNAYDVDSGATAQFSTAFGSTFSFNNFKVLMRAKKTLKPTPPQTALLYRATKWGRSGEKINVGYVYPSIPNAPISSVITVDSEVSIRINLKSGTSVPTSIDDTTEWNISITPNTPSAGIDQVTYTWNGVGTAPALSLSGGEYVNITESTEFNVANTGIFRVSTQLGFLPSATSFSVQRQTGTAVAETNKGTLVNGAITFYNNSPTTAAQINTYVNANLEDYFTTTIVNDGGMTGSGVIVLSTAEDSGFAYDSVFLLDGINWIATTNLTGSPQFIFKKPLSLPTDVGYAFNNAEEIRFIPTTMVQVKNLIFVLAVTGLTTVASIAMIDRDKKLELSTNILGSSGSLQIIGGLGNQYEVPVLDAAARLDNSLMIISTDKTSAQGVHSDQWFKVQADIAQRKETLFSSNSSITVVGNNPSVGQTTIKLLNRLINQRYFGKPRNHIRSRGRTFKVEKQGDLVCLSWNNVGSSPAFMKSPLNLNDTGGGTFNAYKVLGTSEVQYVILTGNANFTEVSIGDLLTTSGLPNAANNGTFLVTGVSDDGLNIRVLNPNGADELSSGTYTFTGNSTAGDTFTIGGTPLIAGTDFAIGGTSQITAANLSAIIGTLAGVSSTANGNVVTVTATSPSANISLAYSGTAVVTVSGAFLVGDSFSAGNFSSHSEVSEGDTFTLASPFSVLNQGSFRVIRRYNDSIWYENSNVIEEEVALPNNYISLGYDGTTVFKVDATNNTQYLTWTGTGTEPNLGLSLVGDVVTFGTDFNAANRGDFMVIRSGAKLQEITQFLMPAGSQFVLTGAGKYFYINSAGDANLYYVWFNVNGTNSDPAIGGRTGLQVAILSGDTAAQVAAKAAAILNVATGLTATSTDNLLTVTTTGSIETTDAVNINVPSPFSVSILQQGRRSFLEAINPSAVNDASVLITNVLNNHRPQMQFWEYEATVVGDQFVVTGDTLTTPNAGTYNISQVIDRDTAIIAGSLASMTNVSLNGRETSVYVQEGVPYTGYKHILLVSAQPGAPQRNYIVFDSNFQYEKFNESSGVQLVSLNKLNFSTFIKKGLDSYRYNTGLIAEANRIIYGDPRDSTTYPGVAAAGADIFVREPLIRRIQVAIVIRINTGVPFAQTAEQVRTSVSSLINSNDIGSSIAISAIVSVVNAIPGIKAVSINSPQYDSTHDVIVINPSEKAKILDPTLDISVSLVGT